MTDFEVRVERLESMRMVSAYGFGPEPEGIAWEKINAFIKNHELEPTRTFGFNNPNPGKGSPNYGYEIWIPVSDNVMPDGDLRIVDFPGGLYAITTFKGLDNIGEVWRKLVKWKEGSKYKRAYHQWLEELTNPDQKPEDYVFHLYLPISE